MSDTMKIKISFKRFFDALLYFVRGLFHRVHSENITLLASGIAFNAILCTIPLLLLFTSFLGTFLNSSDIGMQRIDEVLATVFPNQPYTENIQTSVRQAIEDIVTYRTSFGLFGAIVLIWTGTSLFSAIRIALHRVFRVESTKNLVLSILEDIVWVLLAGSLFLALNLFTWIGNATQALLVAVPKLQTFDWSILTATLPHFISLLIMFFMFLIIYRFIPDQKLPWSVAWVSAVTTAILWYLAGRLFGWYLAEFHSFSKLYGTYAFLLVLLIWVYYSSMVFIVGGIVGQLYRERRVIHQSPLHKI